MSDGGHDDPGDPPESLALAAFDDPEPLTVEEVVSATGMDRDRVESALDQLTTAGRLGTKTVGDRQVWYATPGGGNGSDVDYARSGEVEAPLGDAGDLGEDDAGEWSHDEVTMRGTPTSEPGESAGEFDETAVEAAVADLDVPGTSEMMRDWRRSAVRAAFDHVREVGGAASEEIVDAVYSANQAGYSDADAWWACVAPRLETLPGIERDGDNWEFTGVEG